MATSNQARGKIILAAKNKERIPEGWAITSEGLPTTDANEALKGSVLPLGGPKGSGLAIMLDILTGVLTGAEFGAKMPRMYDDPQPQRVGHMFSAISIEAFMPMTEFLSRMDQKEQETRQGPPAPGFEQVSMPGDGTHARMATHREEGISLTDEVYADLLAAAERYGVSPRGWSREASPAKGSNDEGVRRCSRTGRLDNPERLPAWRKDLMYGVRNWTRKRYWTYQRGIAIMARRGKAGKEIQAWILRR